LDDEIGALGGYLSPAVGVKLTERTSSQITLSRVPLVGGLQMVAFRGLIYYTASHPRCGRASAG